MKSQACQQLVVIQVFIALALIASVSSFPNWPTEEIFERHYRNVAPPAGDLTSNPGHKPKGGNTYPGSTVSSAVAATPNEGETKTLKPRWSNHRRISAREAVAVMEEELQQREAAKSINTPVKDTVQDEIQPAASNADPVPASSNRRSGHHMGVTGPVHTFVKTDKHGHYKWGVRHHAGHGFS